MPPRSVDPARLNGVALTNWYRRSPEEIEAERQGLDAARYARFFGQPTAITLWPTQENTDEPQSIPANSTPLWERNVQRPPYRSSVGEAMTGTAVSNLDPDHHVRSVAFRNVAQSPRAPATPMAVSRSSGPAQTRLPAQPQPPSFFSYMFGGSAPIKSSTGKTVGQYDHQAGRVGMKMTGDYANISQFIHPGDFMESVFAATAIGGVRATKAITKAIEEGIERHHPHPRFLGGPSKQELYDLVRNMHVDFHGKLTAALKEAGFPRVGGPGGSAKNWAEYFAENAGSREKAYEILRRVTRDFDEANGTSISKHLDDILGAGDDAMK